MIDLRHALICGSVVLLASVQALAAEEGEADVLRVGTATVDITPDWKAKKVWIAGYGHGRAATGVHDPITARALVLEGGGKRVALATVDLIGIFYDQTQAVRKRLQGFDYVMVAATHSHEGPDTMGIWGPDEATSGVDAGYLKRVEDGVVEAVLKAQKGLQPVAGAALGAADASAIISDSRKPTVKDGRIWTLKFSGERGKPLAVAVFWASHPEALGSRNTLLTADYVAPLLNMVSRKHGCPSIFFNGPIGGLLSQPNDIRARDGSMMHYSTFEFCEEYAAQAADFAHAAAASAAPVSLLPIEVKSRELLVPLQNEKFRAALEAGVFRREIAVAGEEQKAYGVEPGTQCVRTEVARVRFGDLELLCVPGELYPELSVGGIEFPPDKGADFRQGEREVPLLSEPARWHRIVIGLANDELGYIIPKTQWDAEAPFCYGRNNDQYGEENSIGPDCAPILIGALNALGRKARRRPSARISPDFAAALADARKQLSEARRDLESPWPSFRVQTHNHCYISHDSISKIEQLADGANKAGGKAICMSDHPRKDRKEWEMEPRGVVDGVLFIPGVEYPWVQFGAPDGDKEHFIARFMCHTEHCFVPDEPVHYGRDATQPDNEGDYRSHVIDPDKMDGMEFYVSGADFRVLHKEEFRDTLKNPFTLTQILSAWRQHPHETFYAVTCYYPRLQLERWDSINRKVDRVFPGIASNNAHQNIDIKIMLQKDGSVHMENIFGETMADVKKGFVANTLRQMLSLDKGTFFAQLDPYDMHFRLVANHLICDKVEEEAILRALVAGKCYAGFDWLCPTNGFAFWIEDGDGRRWTLGETVQEDRATSLRIEAPLRCRLRVVRDGVLYWETVAESARIPVPGPGKYRVEALLEAAGDVFPWVITNPIKVASKPRG